MLRLYVIYMYVSAFIMGMLNTDCHHLHPSARLLVPSVANPFKCS